MLTGALRSLFAVAEAYPDLKANQNFLHAAGGAVRHRGQDRLLAPVLQRLRHELQHGDPAVPVRTSSPGCSASRRASTSRSRTPPKEPVQVKF